ncbi:hypothetical protein MKJ04_21085 [Pontibacter sp. E15-1]|uniref:DUF6660 family protein n=1 Tax=Pontibacter sp. E15-1 TaxID=2919918 RepID=UPI001F4F8EF9|nr:DUF6660 family protein [Pontibacter sp. E15-1]MCJ8167349.1 hypothetical protein [Pontibacter sp. E15-1]
MKYLTLIWGILILAMSCLPCTDSGAAYAQDRPTTVQADDLHHDDAQDADLCSPLCECNCCGGITLATHVPKLPAPEHTPQSTSLSTYLRATSFSPSFAFWHPPKA